jgi:protein O-GlcNAc transferase
MMKSNAAAEALELYDAAIEYLKAGDAAAAHKLLLRAAKLQPANADILTVLGHAQERMGEVESGRQSFLRAVKLAPSHPLALRNLATAELNAGDADAALGYADRAFQLEPTQQETASIMLLAATSASNVCAEALRDRHRHAVACFTRNIAPLPLPETECIETSCGADAILRVGYFGHHFYRFPLASFLPHVMAAHDRTRFRVYAFAAHGRMDEVTRHYVDAVDEFHDLTTMNDDEAALYIRAQGIDVLIDTSGLVQGHRLPILARRPARVNMSWLGYFSTLGKGVIDAHVTDSLANPPGMTTHLFDEKLVYLPCQYAYQPLVADVPVATSPCVQNGYVTFGWFSATPKLNSDALNAYAAIVSQVSESRILFVAPSKDMQARILSAFAAVGVKRHRVIFRQRLSAADYFAALSQVDILLDTFPMGGGTTLCDALWMGTPAIALFQPRGFGGAAASVLGSVGLSDCVALDSAHYIANAVRMATDRARLAALRQTLRQTLQDSALMQTEATCRALEAAIIEALQEKSQASQVRATSPAA